MLFEAMSAFDTWHDLRAVVIKLKNSKSVPKQSYDKKSQFKCIMQLQNEMYKVDGRRLKRHRRRAEQAFIFCMQFDRVKEYFGINNGEHNVDADSADQEGEDIHNHVINAEYFLQHLIAQFMSILSVNAFERVLKVGLEVTEVMLIYDVLSLLNHSCIPNLTHLIDGNVMMCFANHKIWKHGELTISYIDMDDLKEHRVHRQHELRKRFGFLCECARCKNDEETTQSQYQIAARRTKWEIEAKLNASGIKFMSEIFADIVAYQNVLGKQNPPS